MSDYGSLVSRTLRVADTAYLSTLHLKGKPSVDAEHNLDSDLSDYNSAARIKTQLFSGVTNIRSAGQDKVFIDTLDPYFVSNFGKFPNEFAIQNFDALVNGWVINVKGSKVSGGNYDDLNYLSIELPESPAPSPMFRQELVYLEVWKASIASHPSTVNKPDSTKVWRHGNVQYGGANLNDELIDPDINAATSLRIQTQYRLRVVADVDFANYPDGVNAPNVKAQGGGSLASTYGYTRSLEDPGLYIAGAGDAPSISALGSVDGYVYAIPVCKVHRRNSSAYALTNPNGSAMSINDSFSDRPDGLFYDEISLNDIQDLRHTVITNQSFSEILESNFDSLIRRDLVLSLGQDPSIDSQIQGLEMLTVDGFSVTDQSGVYDMPFDPDYLRRDYSGESRTHTVMYTLDTSVNSVTGPILYNTTTRLVQVVLSGSGSLQAYPDVYLAGVVQPAAITGSWIGTIPGPAVSGTLDIGLAGQTLALSFDVEYVPAGHRFVAKDYLKVYNDNPADAGEWAFVVNPDDFTDNRSVIKETLPVVAGTVDTINQYPPITLDTSGTVLYPDPAAGSNLSNHCFTEQYAYHVLGNGTATYTVPGMANGSNVLGIHAVYTSDVSPIAFTAVEPTSVTRTITGTFSVVMPASLAATKIIKFVLITDKVGVTLDRITKGIKEIMRPTWSVGTGTGASSYDFIFDNLPYGFGTYRQSGGTLKFFAYVAGLRVDLDNADVQASLNKVTVVFNSPVNSGDEIRIFALQAYSPTPLDKLQISYTRVPYQGLGAPNHLSEARIVAVGSRPIVHTLGSSLDTANRNAEMLALSEVLPLGFNFKDTDLILDNLSLSNTQFTSFKFLRVGQLGHDFRSGSVGKYAEVGDIIDTTPTVAPVTPERGVKDTVINLRNRLALTDYPVEYISPALALAKSHQVVTYYLIQTKITKELFLLVMTYTSNSSGNVLVASDVSDTGVAYDLYRIKGNPILK